MTGNGSWRRPRARQALSFAWTRDLWHPPHLIRPGPVRSGQQDQRFPAFKGRLGCKGKQRHRRQTRQPPVGSSDRHDVARADPHPFRQSAPGPHWRGSLKLAHIIVAPSVQRAPPGNGPPAGLLAYPWAPPRANTTRHVTCTLGHPPPNPKSPSSPTTAAGSRGAGLRSMNFLRTVLPVHAVCESPDVRDMPGVSCGAGSPSCSRVTAAPTAPSSPSGT